MSRIIKTIGLNLFIALVYWLIGRLGETLSPAGSYERIVWFSSGFALATLTIWGPRVLLGILLGSFASNFLNILSDGHAGMTAAAIAAGLIATGAAGGGFLGSLIYRKVSGNNFQLDRLNKSLTLIVPCALLTPAIKFLFGALSLNFVNLAATSSAPTYLGSWWIGDTMGIIVFAPALLAYTSPKVTIPSLARFIEVVALFFTTGFVATWLFAGYMPDSLKGYPVSFTVFPPLIWAALRFTPWITSLIVILFTLIASLGTVHGMGTFASDNTAISLIILQIYLAVIAVIGLILSTLWTERQRDADELRHANTAIKASEDFLQAVISNLPVALFGKDVANGNRFVLWNQMSEELFGLKHDEVIGKNDYDFFPKEQADFFLEKDLEVIRLGKILDITEELIDSKSRGRISLHTTKSTILNADGTPRLLIGFSQDITERLKTEERLRKSEAQFRTMSEASPLGIFLTDAFGACRYVNATYLEVSGLTAEACENEGWSTSIHTDDLARVKTDWYTAVSKQEPYQSTHRFLRPDGSLIWTFVKAAPIHDKGELLGYVGTVDDISERIRAEHDLKQKSDELIRSNRELEQFAFVASHDLQEPLRKVIAFSNLLQEECGTTLGEEGRNYISRMSSACERMQMLIDDILRYSRLTTRANPMERCNLNEVIGSVLSDMDFTIQSANAKISIAPLPILEADSSQMMQLFQNLISNAIKYARRDTPPVIVIDALPTDNNQAWQIRIKDNGIGFDERFVEKIFQPFQRLHKKTDYRGTGIGLAICKKIAERHMGTITATSNIGEGSTFTITLPITQVHQA